MLLASTASAHGGFWRAYDIFFDPTDPDRIVLRSDVWALIATEDGGETWNWICAESYGGDSGNAGQYRSLVVLPGGDIVVASLFDGLRRTRGSWCQWEEVRSFADEVVSSVTAAPSDPQHLFVLTATGDERGGVRGRVWESRDAAESWRVLGSPLPSTFSPASVRVAASDPDRVYVAGKSLDQVDTGVVFRSSDGGSTWQIARVPTAPAKVTNWSTRLLAVHPEDENVIFLWEDSAESGGGDVQPDALWMSDDGGITWRLVFQGVGNLPGFELSPDGRTVFVAGPEDGLWRAALSELPVRGEAAFELVSDRRTWGLTWAGEKLYAGLDDFSLPEPGDQRASLGSSTDEGQSFDPEMIICGVEMLECPSGSAPAEVCPANFTSGGKGEGNFKEDFIDSERCDSYSPEVAVEAAPDAGAAAAPGDVALSGTDASSVGCGCRASAPVSGAGYLGACVSLVGITLRRRRRSTRRREGPLS